MIAQIVPVKRGAKMLPFFDYIIPEIFKNEIKAGQLVLIPLRNKTEFGVVLKLIDQTNVKTDRLKTLEKIIISKPLLSAPMLSFLNEMSDFYGCSFGALFKSSLPPLKKTKLSKIKYEDQEYIQNDNFKKPNYCLYKNYKEKINLIQSSLPASGQTLILIPEISDADKICRELSKISGHEIAKLTSQNTEKEAFEAWFNVWNGNTKVLISTRNGVFLSFQNLAKIIVIDSFDTAHKSWDASPRYHTKDAAIMLAKNLGAEIDFITSSLTVEEYYFIKKGVFESKNNHLTPINKTPNIVNLAAEKRSGNFSPFSMPLQEAIENSINTTFIYCHRKGNFSYICCRDCNNVDKCPDCSQPLTFLKINEVVVCRHCELKYKFSPICDKCRGNNKYMIGEGTAEIEKILKKIFPNFANRIISFDKESKDKEALKKINNPIIVGTDAALQYLDWEKLSLIAIVDADTPLYSSEYLTSERIFNSLRSLATKINTDCDFILQTSEPDHIIFQSLSDPDRFYSSELETRKFFNYPPYYYLLKLFISADNESTISTESNKIHNHVQRLTKKWPDIKITQPQRIFPYRFNGNFRKTLIIKLPYRNYKFLVKMITKDLPEFWKTDPNPITLLSI